MTTDAKRAELRRAWARRWAGNAALITGVLLVAALIFGGGLGESGLRTLVMIAAVFAGFAWWDWRSMLAAGDARRSLFTPNRERNRR